MVAAGLEPLEPYSTANAPWRCRCTRCEAVVTPAYANVNNGAGGCKFCAEFGFDLTGAACVYLIRHHELSAAKIGIMGRDSQRLVAHQRAGWGLVSMWEFEVGVDAQQVEAAVLTWWRDELGAPQALSTADMPIGGETETVRLAAVDLDQTAAFIECLIAAG